MDSLRSFVNTVWITDAGVQREHGDDRAGVWSKPYELAEDFELRRLTTAENRAGLRTDFFEFYWAHLMQGTQIGHVVAWAKTLLFRSPLTVPRHLRLAYATLVALVVLGLVMAYQAAAAKVAGEVGLPVWVNLLVSVAVVPVVLGILINTVGDAARYLHVAPTNVQRRHEIRAAGVKVLKSLHEKGYERIIIVGHSLGSVIGYDILYHAWSSYNTDPPTAGQPAYAELGALEALAAAVKDGARANPVDIQRTQRLYFNELKSNGARWRVSDFVTLGSPLAHAELLLAKNADALAPKFENREFPRCLPVLEERRHQGQRLRVFSYPATAAARVPHHAAVFAPVRWTNLYFPNRLLLWGDLIGGGLQRVFGGGVRDVAVHTRLRGGLFSHTLYWKLAKGKNQHVVELRDALDLLDARSQEEAST
jgi:hypothetical protein